MIAVPPIEGSRVKMFSRRYNWGAPPTPFGRLLAEKRKTGNVIIDLSESNPTRVGFDYDERSLLSALSGDETLIYDPDPRGLSCARQAVADYYQDLGHPVDPGAVLLTPGTSEAYGYVFKLLADPGDEILVPGPGYPLLPYLAGFEGLACHSYPLRYGEGSGWFVDLDVLSALITDKTRAVVIVNPNNPTGSYVKKRELEQIDSLCSKSGVALIVDEVFSDFEAAAAPDRERTVVNRTRALTFVFNGVSKMLGLPQLKLGWMVVGGDGQLAKAALEGLEALLDFYLPVSTPVQLGLKRLLGGRSAIQGQIQARIAENSRLLASEAGRTRNCRVLDRQGGWYAVMEIRDGVSDEARALCLLREDHILIHPGFFYDFHREGVVVLSLLSEPAIFRQGVDRLLRRFAIPPNG
jgi:alanine-synthesizing transaminase